jgi:hypothetical protein
VRERGCDVEMKEGGRGAGESGDEESEGGEGRRGRGEGRGEEWVRKEGVAEERGGK